MTYEKEDRLAKDEGFTVRATGELVFANGYSVQGTWYFRGPFGFGTNGLRNALVRKARDSKIPGRSQIVEYVCRVRRL